MVGWMDDLTVEARPIESGVQPERKNHRKNPSEEELAGQNHMSA
jgi:hypothetical protein